MVKRRPPHGDVIERRMEELGLDQDDVGERMVPKRSQTWVSRTINGGRTMTAEDAAELARVLDVDVRLLLRDSRASPSVVSDITGPLEETSRLSRDLPVLGSAVGGQEGWFDLNGQVNEHVERPPSLIGVKNAFAVYMHGDSMEPRYTAGTILFCNPNRPVRITDYAVIEFADNRALVGQVTKMSEDKVVLRKLNPDRRIELARAQVRAIHRIVGTTDPL